MDSMRYPNRFLLLSSFCLACLAAVGLHHVVALNRRRGGISLSPALLCGCGVILLGAGLWARRPEFLTGIAASCLLWAGALLLAWLLLVAKRKRRAILVTMLLAVLGDLWIFRGLSGYAATFPIAAAMDPSEPAKLLKLDKSVFRTLSLVSLESGLNRNDQLRNLLQANLSSVWGLDSGDAWGSLFPVRYYLLREELVWELTHSPESAEKLSPILGALNVKYLIGHASSELKGWEAVFSDESLQIWRNPNVLPRAFLVGNTQQEDLEFRDDWEEHAMRRLEPYHEMVADWSIHRADAQIVDHVLTRGTDYRTTALINSHVPALSGRQPEFSVEDLTGPNETDRMRFRVQTDQPALMVISNSYDPGWSATVNGIDTEILRTNWITQGVFVSAGESEVLLSYRASGWLAGTAVSFVSILLVVGILLHRRKNFAFANS